MAGQIYWRMDRESKCSMGPDQPPSKTKGTRSSSRSAWVLIVAKGEGEIPDGGTGNTIMTLGYDPRTTAM